VAIPTMEQLEKWAEGYVRGWNAGEKEAGCQNDLDIAPGEDTMSDPLGTPPKHGFEKIVASYDLFQPTVRFEVPRDTLFFKEEYVAWVRQNLFQRRGAPVVGETIECSEFGADGALNIRTHCVIPSHDDEALGDLYKVYLPDEPKGSK